jgi:hypothetical protein
MKKIMVPVDTDDAAYIIGILCGQLQRAEERAEYAEEELAYHRECAEDLEYALVNPWCEEDEDDDPTI